MVNSIINPSHEHYMRHAIALSQQAREHGNHPFGALLVVGDNVVLTAENTVLTGASRLNHAEMNLAVAISTALAHKKFTKEDLQNSTFYTSTEPCTMCTGALYTLGIKKIVFGCPAKTLGKLAHPHRTKEERARHIATCVELLKNTKDVTVIGPILKDEAKRPHADFWSQKKT